MRLTYLIVLAVALLSIEESRADVETWDPFETSAAETQYIIDTYAGEELCVSMTTSCPVATALVGRHT